MNKLTSALILSACLFAQEKGGRLQFDWDKIAAKATEKVDVNLEGPALRSVSQFLSNDKKDESQVKQLIQGLKGVYVKSFEFAKEGQYSDADLNGLRAQLRTPDWSKLVEVQEEKENVAVYMRSDGTQFQGMVVLAVEPTEVTFVQIVGAIDPSMLGALSGQFGIPKMHLGPTPKAVPAKKKSN